MAFWRFNPISSSQIGTLLAKEDVTLYEVMDEEDIINECRTQNKPLIEFLLKPEILEELITLTTREPSDDIDEKSRFKYPNVASELLTCDVPAINEKLASDKALLDKLYSFLECEPPLNSLLASYFSKIMGALIARKTDQQWLSYQLTCLQVLDFLKAKDTFIPLLLKHLGTSAIMDLILKLMTQVEGADMGQNVLNWLDSQKIMQQLVSFLNPKTDSEMHYYVAQLLCDFIRMARIARSLPERVEPDPLLQTMESPETVSMLLDNILNEEKNETAIVGGIQVLLSLLDVYHTGIPKVYQQNMYNSNDEANDIEMKQKIIFTTTQAITARISDFHNLLLDPPKKMPILTTVGVLDPPLGNTRLHITKLFASIISSNNDDLIQEIISLGTIPVLLDLFFNYPFNNFLHTQVERCLTTALNMSVPEEGAESSNALCNHLLIHCKLIERILNAYVDNDNQQSQENGIRKGYMGHLWNILRKVYILRTTTLLGQYITDNLAEIAKSLDEFDEKNGTNKCQEALQDGVHPTSSIEDNEDYNLQPQQMFTQYQIENLTPSYRDSGLVENFNEDDDDDALSAMQYHSDMNFDVDLSSDYLRQKDAFKKLCSEKMNPFDDSDDQIFEEKELTFQTVIEKRIVFDELNSDSDDDESPTVDHNMDVDAWPKADDDEKSSTGELFSTDPWGTGDTTDADATNSFGWADFSSVKFETNFNNDLNKNSQKTLVENDLNVENVVDDRFDNVILEEKQGVVQDTKIENHVDDKVASAAGDQVSDTTATTTEPSKPTIEGTKSAVDAPSAAASAEEDVEKKNV